MDERERLTAGQEYTENLLTTIFSAENETALKALFDELLTAREKRDITIRWGILNDIARNVPQRAIAEKYGTSLTKTAKCSAILRKRGGFLSKLFRKRLDETKL